MTQSKAAGSDRKISNNPRKKHTAQGGGRNARFTNKHKKRHGKKYRGQGR